MHVRIYLTHQSYLCSVSLVCQCMSKLKYTTLSLCLIFISLHASTALMHVRLYLTHIKLTSAVFLLFFQYVSNLNCTLLFLFALFFKSLHALTAFMSVCLYLTHKPYLCCVSRVFPVCEGPIIYPTLSLCLIFTHLYAPTSCKHGRLYLTHIDLTSAVSPVFPVRE